ncbi:negative elongation factor A-like, partial [Uloborus diversus]|uniref:negative elongation factor A-like n=1 Tax=Uloborus diversus TaxID=327109 RepID=UPI002409747D
AQAIQGECTAQVTAQALAQASEQQLTTQRQSQQQTTVTVAGATNIIPPHQAQAVIASLAQAQQLQQVQLSKANLPQGAVTSVSLAKSLTSGIMVNASPGSAPASTFATISKALGQAGVTSISSQAGAAQNAAIAAALTNANLRNQRATVTAVGTTTSMTVQEMVAAAAGQVRGLTTTAGSTSTAPAVVSVAGLTAVQLAASQRIAGSLSAATTVASSAVNPLNTQVTTQRNINQLTQMQAIRQTALIRQREQQNLKQQQHLKRLQTVQQQQASQQAAKVAVGAGGTLTVTAAQQRVAQQQVSLKQSVGRQMTEAEMAQLMKRQQLQQQKQAQLTTAQILAQAHLQQVQPQQVSITGGTATLVKTVSAPLSGASSMAIPVSAVTMGGVNINVSLPQGKTGAAQTKGATTITNQQLRQFQIQQQLLTQARKGSKVSANLTQLAKVPSKSTGITASSLSAPMNAVQIVQHNAQVGTTQQVKGLPAAMTVQQIQQAMKAIPQNLPVVVTATPSLPGVQQQHTSTTLRGEPGVATGSVKAQTTTLPSTTLTTSGVLKGTPAVVVGQQQTAAILQQVAASTSGLTAQQAVTLAVRAAASQAQGQQQVQIQVQQSPHSSLVTPQSQVVSTTIQPGQTRVQQLSQSASTINIAQPVAVQSTAQASSILSSAGTIVPQMSAESTHVVMHSVSTSNSGTALSIPASLATSQTASTTAQVVQAAIQAARQQQQQAAQQAAQQQKASPYTMRLRNPPK